MHYTVDDSFAEFIRLLPKTENHLHLEGCVSFEQLHKFAPDIYPEPPPFWHPEFRYRSFGHFQEEFNQWVVPYHNRVDRYHETAKYVFGRCFEQGCKYVETSFHLPVINRLSASGPELLAAILAAAPAELEVRLFGGICHNDFQPNRQLLEEALEWNDLAGIDLHGPEHLEVDQGIAAYWRKARMEGKVTKAHAGEFMPAAFVSWAIDRLKVDRIQHGVRAVESDELLERIASEGVTLDMCPLSNVKLGVAGVPDMKTHPIRTFFDRNVRVTVSTDDTFMLGNTLEEEYYALQNELSFTRLELIHIAKNGFDVALLAPEIKASYRAELDQIAILQTEDKSANKFRST